MVRIHPEILESQKLPKPLVTKHIWQERFEDIGNFEHYLARNGIAVVKFFLHLSKKEQRRRFMGRLDTPDKNWKFSTFDVKERQFWDEYQEAYEAAKKNNSFLGKVLAAGMANLSEGHDAALEAMHEVGEEQNMRLEQRNGHIALIAQIGIGGGTGHVIEYTGDAIRTLARYLFEERGHHRLIIDPAVTNERAIGAYEKVGFRSVGVMPKMRR